MIEGEQFGMTKTVDEQVWREHKAEIERYHYRAVGDALIDWLREHGTAIVDAIDQKEVRDSIYPGMLQIRYRVHVTPIGPDHGEYYFFGGPVDGKYLPTDGGAFWRVVVTTPPWEGVVSLTAMPPAAPYDPGLRYATYVKKRDYYVFEGMNR